MKVLMINGSPRKNGSTSTVFKEMEKVFHELSIETEIIYIPHDTSSCMACGYCHKNNECVKKDIVNETYSKLDEADGIIVGSPVYYANPNGSLISFLDRLFYSYPNAALLNMKAGASIAIARRSGNLTSNDVLTKFFSINGMSIITSTYWNDPHGSNADSVVKDEEGMQTARNLARNMAYYLMMRKLAADNNLNEPEIERGKFTNFIR